MIKFFRKIKQNLLMENKIILALLLIVFISCKPKPTLPDPFEAGWKGEKVCEVIEDSAELRVLKCTFPPGVGHEKHYHNPHFGYTLSGSRFKIRDTTGTREVDVPTGSSFSKDHKTWHEVLNIGDSTAVFLIIEPK